MHTRVAALCVTVVTAALACHGDVRGRPADPPPAGAPRTSASVATPQPPGPASASASAPAPASATIAAVGITVRPQRGMAMWELHADGSMTGAHLSGDDPPFVHQDRGELAPESRAKIWAAARAVLAAPQGASLPEGADTVTLWIRLSDTTTVRRTWRTGTAPSDPALQALLELVTAHHIGGW